MFKVMTLNLFRYTDWGVRKDNIINVINSLSPDVIAFQEVLTNRAFSDFPQSDFIADKCGYKYRSFEPTLIRTNSSDQNGNKNQQASEGQAIISKHPIISTESYFLKQYPDYPEDVSVQFCTVEIGKDLVNFCNVHFANNHIAYNHLDEVLDLIAKRDLNVVILGDFNIYKLADYKNKNQGLTNYTLSSEEFDYISYPADGESLDYIAIPTSKFKFIDIKCPNDYLSDHNAVFAEIGGSK